MDRLLSQVRPLVVRYCRARVGRQERSFASADDVAQEVCLAVLTALPSYRDQGRPFLAFVYGIAAHKVADAHRAAARNRSEPVADVPDEPDEQAGPEQRAMRGELSGEMAELLKVLPPKQREIVVLRVVVGLSAEETADAVGSTPGAVRVRAAPGADPAARRTSRYVPRLTETKQSGTSERFRCAALIRNPVSGTTRRARPRSSSPPRSAPRPDRPAIRPE